MTLFVGDRPSSKNKDQNVAFVGTKSFKTLDKWAKKLGITNYEMMNSHEPALLEIIKDNSKLRIVIALGNVAAKRLKKADIPHIMLSHPSGRNRKLNNPEYVEEMLWNAKMQLESLRSYYFGLAVQQKQI